MNSRWFLQASRWARNPPSAKRVWFGIAVIALCLVLAGLDWVFGGPDLQPQRMGIPATKP